uniref:Uncharacterized protein n=1 Tax=Syphacia muris TaxID=451379 RepID=A0A0N5AZT3_9BILA
MSDDAEEMNKDSSDSNDEKNSDTAQEDDRRYREALWRKLIADCVSILQIEEGEDSFCSSHRATLICDISSQYRSKNLPVSAFDISVQSSKTTLFVQ